MLFAQAAAEATAISNDNARAAPVAISGATGSNAAFINGVYEPTHKKRRNGRVLYRKRSNPIVIVLEAAIDNRDEPDDLPISPWN